MRRLLKIDPTYWTLRLILRGFINAELRPEEYAFVELNLRKHRAALWVNVLASVFVFLSLRQTPPAVIGVVITSLFAPVMVLGGAWFAISFGGVPKRLINTAMITTLLMFIAFSVSLSAMFIAVGCVVSPYLWPVLALIYACALASCIQYDTADGLKAGLDEARYRTSLAALLCLKGKGIDPDELGR